MKPGFKNTVNFARLQAAVQQLQGLSIEEWRHAAETAQLPAPIAWGTPQEAVIAAKFLLGEHPLQACLCGCGATWPATPRGRVLLSPRHRYYWIVKRIATGEIRPYRVDPCPHCEGEIRRYLELPNTMTQPTCSRVCSRPRREKTPAPECPPLTCRDFGSCAVRPGNECHQRKKFDCWK